MLGFILLKAVVVGFKPLDVWVNSTEGTLNGSEGVLIQIIKILVANVELLLGSI